MLLSQRQHELDAAAPAHLQRMRVTLGDGAETTVHVASYPLATTRLRVERLPGPMTLEQWCAAEGVQEALVGGFYIRQPQTPADPLLSGMPLGQLRARGEVHASVAFDAPWDARRACVQVSASGEVQIARRDQLPELLDGELLQAGPLLVSGGQPASYEDEGFSAGAGQFDSDITAGRHPRAALGRDERRLLAVACDGRTEDEAGLTLDELAQTLLELGADAALNLDGGGSTSLVCGGRLRNVPREGDGVALVGGRPIATALAFA
ncbi:MAG TPA: phosphodiester glycosidase family protein, partial [Thermoleophilaceae bacterium]